MNPNSNATATDNWWTGLDKMVEKASTDPMSSAPTPRCCYPDCDALLESVGWICLCCHTFCEAHAPTFVRGTSGPNHRRRCHLCQTDLLPNEVNRFCVEENRAAGKFSQVGCSLNETFDMLGFSLDRAVKEDQDRETIRAKLSDLADSDDRDLAEAEAAKEAAKLELTGLQAQCDQQRHTCRQFGKSLNAAQKHLDAMTGKMRQYCEACKAVDRNVTDARNQRGGMNRQLNDRESENKRMSNQMTSAQARLNEFKHGNVWVDPPMSAMVQDSGGSHASVDSRSGAGPSHRHGNDELSDATSSIGPSASAVRGQADSEIESDFDD